MKCEKNGFKKNEPLIWLFSGKYQYLLIILTAFILCSFTGTIDKQKTEIPAKFISKPSWMGKEPLVYVGNWDGLELFRRRVGGSPVWKDEDYIKEHSEEAVKKLKEIGVTMAMIHFYKGFGLEAEKKQLEDSKRLAALCKKYGIRVGVYVGSTVGYETFLVEKPDAKDWFVPDSYSQPVRYWGQSFRKRVYFMHPGYIQYIKEVLRIAVQDLKADLIHFDNTSMQGQQEIFYHPMAIEDFKTFLREKYTPEQLEQRFGFSNVSYVEPPIYTPGVYDLVDPMVQEWADFRCVQLAKYYNLMGLYIQSLNPEVAVENNPSSGMSGGNTIVGQGVDYPRLLANTNAVWTEEGNNSNYKDEILISKIRSYKMGGILNNIIFTYTGETLLQMAESMAYNKQCLGMVGGGLAGTQLPEEQKNYVRFFHDKFDYYRDIKNIANVAVLHSFTTMAFNYNRPYVSTFLFEQSLIQAKIPFDLIFDDNLKDLSKYKVLVLADQECLSDDKLELIRNFVSKGGGLVASEQTSLKTEWGQRKRDFGLKDLLNIKAPELKELIYFDFAETGSKITSPVKNQFGSGRVIYIPEIIPSIPKPAGSSMSSKYWKLPKNYTDLVQAVKWAAGDGLSVDVTAPPCVAMELTASEKGDKIMLHLLNYKAQQKENVKDIKVILKVPQGKRVHDVNLLSPDKNINKKLLYEEKEGRVSFSVPDLEVYDLVVVNFM
ncbi:MAG: hypothetical protein M0Q53_15675 [Prolixibacteraceae bacterium]|jgi:hypothetical protein|nr:hypothetical protein [Prolixibacteraceae bacterium]